MKFFNTLLLMTMLFSTNTFAKEVGGCQTQHPNTFFYKNFRFQTSLGDAYVPYKCEIKSAKIATLRFEVNLTGAKYPQDFLVTFQNPKSSPLVRLTYWEKQNPQNIKVQDLSGWRYAADIRRLSSAEEYVVEVQILSFDDMSLSLNIEADNQTID